MSDDYKCQLRRWFDQADTDGSGTLSRLEMLRLLRRGGCKDSTDEIDKWFDQIDVNKDDSMTFDELWSALTKRDPKTVQEEELRSCFTEMDADKSGYLDVEEIKAVLRKAKVKGNAEKIVDGVDRDGDGRISFEEFLKAWRDSL